MAAKGSVQYVNCFLPSFWNN